MKKYILLIFLLAIFFISCENMLLGPEPENNPKDNFDILWKTFDENYALFSVKNINWDSLYTLYNSKISASTNSNELWDIITGLLSNLNDGHTKLFNENYTKGFNSSEIAKRSADDFSLDLIKSSKLENVKVVGSGLIIYGKIKNENIGYIHIASFAISGSYESQWAYDIDDVVTNLADCDAIIVDLRNNGGGLRITEDIIASAFIDRQITYFYQQTKIGPGHNELSERFPITISPREGKIRFTKKTVILTNRFSASGAEWVTQVFKNLEYSTQIGDTTFGAFGDIISVAELPNGWTYTYPCRLTTTPEGKCYEGRGIVPNYLVENTSADINAGKDNVINFAIEYLNNSIMPNRLKKIKGQ